MEDLKKLPAEYLEKLTERAKKSKIYESHQLTGLLLAETLDDRGHKSLYMRLAKKYDADRLLRLAKKIAENTRIQNKGAYFMKVFFDNEKEEKPNQEEPKT